MMNLCILLSNLSTSIVQTSSKVKNYLVGGSLFATSYLLAVENRD